mgnify:CR=1 FL=1
MQENESCWKVKWTNRDACVEDGDALSSGVVLRPSKSFSRSSTSSSLSSPLKSLSRLSNLTPFSFNNSSYFFRRSTKSFSCSLFLRLLGGCGGTTLHSTPALTQLEQGLFLSHRTLRCWQSTQLVPRVNFMEAASWADCWCCPPPICEEGCCCDIMMQLRRQLYPSELD